MGDRAVLKEVILGDRAVMKEVRIGGYIIPGGRVEMAHETTTQLKRKRRSSLI